MLLTSHWTHPDFDLRILQNNVPHCQRGLDGAVVYQQSCQADQVVLSEQAAILGVVQPERNSPLFKGHAKCVNHRPNDNQKVTEFTVRLLGSPAPGASSTLSRSLKPQFSPMEPL